jgi:hypothetical protein
VPSNLAASSAGLDGALTGYWKMGDGTLDEAPLIADQTNATLGSDVDLTTGSTTAPDSWQVISANSINYTNSNNALEFYETGFTVTTGKTYKITLTVSNYTGSGSLGWSSTGGVPNPEMRLTSNGTVSSAFVATGNVELRLFGRNTNTGTLTVSVNEVGGNPALMINTPTIVTDAPLTKIRNYYRMGDGILDKFPLICDMIEPSLGSELVTNGDFATDSDWILTNNTGSNTRITNGTLIIETDGAFTAAQQNDFLTIDKTFKLTYTISSTDNGNLVLVNGSEEITIPSSVGTHNVYWKAQIDDLVIKRSGVLNVTIDNVSVKKVNGVAGIMTNMSEADITNDVPS